MIKFKIRGGQELQGEISVSGAKNSALKLIPSAILADSQSTILNIPDISDIHRLVDILTSIGTEIEFSKGEIKINPKPIYSTTPDSKLIKKLRGSIVLIGPLLAKYGEAQFSKPGGCLIGARPIDDHLDLFKQLGVEIIEKDESYHFIGKPKAGEIVLNKMSVTATENAIMATVLSPGNTKISVAAAEPEIADLATFLNKMGAKIKGAGTHTIMIEGVDKLEGSIINRSPYSKNLAPGYYNVRVKKEDHHTWEATFRVEAEKVTRYPSVVLFKSTPVITPLTDQRKIELIYSPEETLAIKDANSLNYYGSEIWLNGTLVTRFSNPILSISWYPDKAHIIFQQKDEIRIIDKDGSNNVLLVKLGSELPTRFTTNHKGDELYYVDRGQYYQALIR